MNEDQRQKDNCDDDDDDDEAEGDDQPSPLLDLSRAKGAEAGSQGVQHLEKDQAHITIVGRVRFRPLRQAGVADRCLILSLRRLESYLPRPRQTALAEPKFESVRGSFLG